MQEKFREFATVVSQECLGNDIYSMWIRTEQVAKLAHAGQFISVYSKNESKMLPRPISICEIEGDSLRIVYRVTGAKTGTEEFSNYTAGETVEILGPLGNGFPLDLNKKAFLIGGGIGVPPMLELAKSLSCEKQIIAGYRNADLFLDRELSANGTLYVATEDGSVGTKGNVLDAIRENGLDAEVIYACGPTPMLRAIKAYAEEHHILCYISLEEKMACGIGACLACVCKSKETDHHTHVHNKRICKDGPVFLSTEVEL